MKRYKERKSFSTIGIVFLVFGLLAGCGDGDTPPFVIQETCPAAGEELMPVNTPISITFSRMAETQSFSVRDVLLECGDQEINFSEAQFEHRATKMYRTAPPEGIWQHPPYFHNGMAPTLADVVILYKDRKALGLTSDQQSDLVEYLKSL
jgi:hypothetical protein